MEELSTNTKVDFDPFLMGQIINNVLYSEMVYYKEKAIELYKKGYKPVLSSPIPESDDPTKRYESHYFVTEINGVEVIDARYDEVINEHYITAEIERLKNALASTDYIWLKTWEARIMGRSDPYSAEDLSKSDSEREALRTQINVLQAMLTS